MKILAVGAHPDDMEILCAGTLLKYRQAGHDVAVAIATNGEQGHAVIEPEELADIRKSEAEASCNILGAELIWMGYPDQFLFHDEPTRRVFIDMIRTVKPDVIFTHTPDDYAMDHRLVSELVFAASFMASAPHIRTAHTHTSIVPPVFYMDTIGGGGFLPVHYVDISDVIDKKIEMLECHESQIVWLREHDNLDISELTRTVARFRGLSCGVQHAEGFRHLDAWGRTPLTGLLP